jgi:hypothetical protein
LAGGSVYSFAQSVRPDHTNTNRATSEVSNQGSEQRQPDGERGCPVDRIKEPQVLGVTLPLAAKLFAQDCVIRVALCDALS